MRKGFDNDKYLAMQSEHIRERIQQFDNSRKHTLQIPYFFKTECGRPQILQRV